jgi:predicted transcriptional regulator
MRSVMLSIQPKWCELIASGKKTVEVRNTRPNIETPFKCYIYETLGKKHVHHSIAGYDYDRYGMVVDSDRDCVHEYYDGSGKVIGEFVCDSLILEQYNKNGCGLESVKVIAERSCVPSKELYHCLRGRNCYCWHISDLKIYDEPKELNEFKQYIRACYFDDLGLSIPKCAECKRCNLTKPPQSWFYVKEREESK